MHVEPQKQNAEKKKNSRPHYDLFVILQKSQFSQNTTIYTYIHNAENSFTYSKKITLSRPEAPFPKKPTATTGDFDFYRCDCTTGRYQASVLAKSHVI